MIKIKKRNSVNSINKSESNSSIDSNESAIMSNGFGKFFKKFFCYS